MSWSLAVGYLEAFRWIVLVLRLFDLSDPAVTASEGQPCEPMAASVFQSLELNQAFIEVRRPELRDAPDRESKTGALRLREPEPGAPGPDFDDPRSVVRFLLSVLDSGTVYPTEGYFYFRFNLDGRRISGNLRFTSIDEGTLHTGYFETNADTGRVPGIGAVRTATFAAEQGLTVASEPLHDGGTLHRVTLDGETTAFVIPRVYREMPPGIELLAHEQLVSGVLDESGYALALIFDSESPRFRYLLANSRESPEGLHPVKRAASGLVVGEHSGFVFARDASNRLTLVGVDRARIMANDYFDGPFDQVPPDLALRPMLHRAYPYTRTASPIDEHGNFLGRDSSRVAIAPYTAYSDIDELLERYTSAADGPTPRDPIQVLTREYQQDFAPPLRASPVPDAIPVGTDPVTLQDILERDGG